MSEQAVKEQVSTLLRLLSAPNRAALGDAAATRRFVGTGSIGSEWLPFLFQEAPIHMAVVDGPEHRFVAANQAFREMAAGHVVDGMRYGEVFPERFESLALLDRVLSTGERVVASDRQKRFTRAGESAVADGYLTLILQPLPGPAGRTAGVAIFSLDVTDAVRARERAEQLESEELAILDTLPVGVVLMDRAGLVRRINRAGAALIPFDADAPLPPEQVVTLRDATTGRVLAGGERPLARALRGERVPETDLAAQVVATGREMVIRASAAPLFDGQGAIRGAIGVFTEVARQPGEGTTERSA